MVPVAAGDGEASDEAAVAGAGQGQGSVLRQRQQCAVGQRCEGGGFMK